jgi:hypothetical protein
MQKDIDHGRGDVGKDLKNTSASYTRFHLVLATFLYHLTEEKAGGI